MVQRVSTVAFEGIEARSVDVQVQVAPACRPSLSCNVNGNFGSIWVPFRLPPTAPNEHGYPTSKFEP